jgi:hypothetical protein
MSKLAMAGDHESGSIIAVFNEESAAEAWLDKMVNHLLDDGLFLEEAKIEQINTKYRAGVIFKKLQMELFEIDGQRID